MKIKETTIRTYNASIIMGLKEGYSELNINKRDVILYLQKYQNTLIKEDSIYLSACISDCNIVLSGQSEPHIKISFINYPKFPLTEKILENKIINLAKALIAKFKQNRIVVQLNNKTIMLERTDNIDNSIIKN